VRPVIAWILALSAGTLIAISLAVLALHFVPSIIAFRRNVESKGWILLVNIFLGWTGIGWLITLIWAFNARLAPAYRNF
jgi:Superinfection immunity protein